MDRISVIKCPNCGFEQKIFKADDKSVISFECENCGTEILAKNKWCIYCEFGDSPCKVRH